MKDRTMSQVDYAIINNDIAELKRLWKKTCNYNAGINYGKYLFSIGDIEMAKKIFLELKKLYQNKGTILHYLSKIEMCLGNYEKAKYYINIKDDNDNNPYNNIIKSRLYRLNKDFNSARMILDLNSLIGKKETILELVYLDIHEKKYEDALRRLITMKFYFKDSNEYYRMIYEKALLFLTKKLNVMPDEEELKEVLNTYVGNQMICYDEEKAKGHILRHQEGYVGKLHQPLFYKETNLLDLFYNIKDKLNEDTYVITNIVDLYCVRCDGVGSKGEDYVLVITLPNTLDVLNMYPIESKKAIRIDPLERKRDI